MTLEQAIGEAARNGLVDLQIRESLGGWQAIAKYRSRRDGPWGVGCHEDAATAINLALAEDPAPQTEMGVFD